MPEADLPQTVADFVIQQLTALPDAARLAVVFDPYGDLDLGETLETEDRIWRVTRYDGHDLAFRQAYRPGERDLLWVTCSPGWVRGAQPRIELRSLMDVWRRADKFVDASLPGVLQQLVPNETWPADSVWKHAEILGQNLSAVVSGVKTLRRYLEHGAALDAHAIRALALHCLQRDPPIQDFLFRHDTPAGVLDAYIRLLWEADWDAQGMAELQTQARDAPRLELGDAAAWLDVPPASLAVYLYLRRLLSRYRVRGIANQLRGLGLLDFDPEPLEPWVESVLTRWERHPNWRRQIIVRAEESLQADDLARIVVLLGLDSPKAAFEALLRADTPATIYALGAHFFQVAFEARKIKPFTPHWAQRRPLMLADPPQTPFTDGALALGVLFDELAIMDQRRGQPIPSQAELAQLLDWYVQEGIYDLEYAHARAARQILYLPNEKLRARIQKYLDFLQTHIRQYLDELDHALAERITGDWAGYLHHPRLSTNVLWDAVKKRRLSPTPEACLWVVIFDGMRWDTWARHVRPQLLVKFEFVVPEKAYLSLLPSWTAIARTGLLAGKPPAGWKSYKGHHTKDQEQLVSQLMSLPQRERRRLLRFYSGMESDRQYGQLDITQRLPYNVLVYNLSDDNLHSQRGNLVALNETVDRLLDDIFQMLDNLVQPGDTMVVSSDHGFVELMEGDEAVIADDDRWQRYREGGAHPVRYRYALTHDLPDDLKDVYRVSYPGVRDCYTVAVGRRWFKRADWRGPTDRYAHGGLSFAEMMVPGAVLRRIVEPRVELTIETEPRSLQLTEGEVATLTVRVVNRGNVLASGRLQVRANTAAEAVSYGVQLRPGESQDYPHPVEAVYHQRGDRTIEMTQRVNVSLSYTDAEGETKTRRKRVTVEVTPRTDVVEIDFGGLDDIEI
ncbi:MAG: PglZ domain-containing protein [Anaerolineales bacterium]|nr:MAG: PglZ domain-containing protein [Anaerolineales bacterium]